MTDEHKEETAALHALELLEGPERARFLEELQGNPGLRALVSDLRGASASLALTAPEAEPPAALRARVLSTVAARAAGAPAPPAARLPAWVPWLAAACIGIAAFSGSRYVSAQREVASLREQGRIAQGALERAHAELEGARMKLSESGRAVAELAERVRSESDLANLKIATLASMLGNSPEALAVAVWDPARSQGVLKVSRLPALAAGKDYQLWIVDAQYPEPVNGGVFVVDPATGEAHVVFRPDRPVQSIAKFAVSLERKGGVPRREGPIVLLSP